MAKSILLLVFLIFSSKCDLHTQPNRFGSLSIDNNLKREDTSKVNEFNGVARSLALTKPDSGLSFAQKALELSLKINWLLGIGQSYHNIGTLYYYTSDYSLSLQFFESSLCIWDSLLPSYGNKIKILELKAKTIGNMGIVYDDQGDYPKAIEYYLMALKIAEQVGNQRSIATKLGNIGVTFCHNGEYEKALEYYFKALDIGERLNDTGLIASQMSNIGYIYYVQKNYKKAIDVCSKAEKIAKAGNFKEVESNACGTIGHVYYDQQEYANALPYFNKTLQLSEELKNKSGIAKNLSALGVLYFASNQYSKAENYLLRALAIDTTIGFTSDTYNTSEELSKLYEKLGNDKKALFYYRMSVLAKDSLFTINKNKEIARREFTYELEKQHIADSTHASMLLNSEMAETARQTDLKEKALYAFIAVGLVALFMVFLWLIERRFSGKKEITNKELQSFSEKIKKDQLKLQSYYSRLEDRYTKLEKHDSTKKKSLMNIEVEINQLLGSTKSDLELIEELRKNRNTRKIRKVQDRIMANNLKVLKNIENASTEHLQQDIENGELDIVLNQEYNTLPYILRKLASYKKQRLHAILLGFHILLAAVALLLYYYGGYDTMNKIMTNIGAWIFGAAHLIVSKMKEKIDDELLY